MIGTVPRPRKGSANFLASPEIPSDPSQIGQALKAAREDAGLSQKAVAERVGVDSITISRWERGVRRPPRAAVLLLAKVYGQPPERFGEASKGLDDVPRGTVRNVEAAGGRRVAEPADAPGQGARHAKNLPLRVREYLAELRLRLTKGGALEEEIEEAMDLLRSPALFTFYKGGTPSEFNEEDVLRGMKALAEGVVIPELRDRGRKIK